MELVYLDNAASSWPKPPQVAEAMHQVIVENGANPGRGSHAMAVSASRILFQTRMNLAKLFNISNANDISFALNTTHALNQAIQGYVKPGDHVICTSIEHNSVRRPLEYLKHKIGIEVSYVPAAMTGEFDMSAFSKLIKPNTTLVACTHSSNLVGTIVPIERISERIKSHEQIKLLVDAAQTAGSIPIDVEKMGIDMLAFPGHKGLLGPQGTGGLYVHSSIDLQPLMHGGTGSQSESIEQPNVRPDRYESGTQNTVGIAGLNEGVKFVLEQTVKHIHQQQFVLTQRLMEGLMNINGVTVYGPQLGVDKTGVVAFNIEHKDSSEVAFMLDKRYNIAVRSGYHCTPLAHEAVGTIKTGAVRASMGYYNTEAHIDYLIQAVSEISTQTI